MSRYPIKIDLTVQDFDRWIGIAERSYRHLRFSPSGSGEYYAINKLIEVESKFLNDGNLRFVGWYPGDRQQANVLGTLHYGGDMEWLGTARILEVGPVVNDAKAFDDFLKSIGMRYSQ